MNPNSLDSRKQERKDTKKQKKIIKSKFSPLEDMKLRILVLNSTNINWNQIASNFYNRSARQCRERWQNYLDPSLVTAEWTKEDDEKILELYKHIGSHWNTIAKSFPGRSGNSIRNRYLVLKRQEKRKELELLYSTSSPVETSPPPLSIEAIENKSQNEYFSPALYNFSTTNIQEQTTKTTENVIDRIFNDKTLDNILHDDNDFIFTDAFPF